jgi:hypothetical protein
MSSSILSDGDVLLSCCARLLSAPLRVEATCCYFVEEICFSLAAAPVPAPLAWENGRLVLERRELRARCG